MPATSAIGRAVLVASLMMVTAGSCSGNDSAEQAPIGRRLETNIQGRSVVARVNGAPVFAECVARHARAQGTDARAALDACIDFEVAAQAAQHFADDVDVKDAGRRQMVRQLVHREFLPTADEPSDIPNDWLRKRVWNKRVARAQFNHAEYRGWIHALAPINKAATASDKADARRLAEQIAREFRGERDIDPMDFKKRVEALAGQREVILEASRPKERMEFRVGTVKPFANVLFSMNDVGRTSGVVETRFGYHVILLLRITPAQKKTFAEVVPFLQKKVWKRWRVLAFEDWADRRVAAAGVDNPVNDERRRPRLDVLLDAVTVDVGGVAMREESAINRDGGDD